MKHPVLQFERGPSEVVFKRIIFRLTVELDRIQAHPGEGAERASFSEEETTLPPHRVDKKK